MPLKSGQTSVRGEVVALNTKTITGFDQGSQRIGLQFSFAPSSVDEALLATLTLAASADQTLDLRSFTASLGDAITGVSASGLIIYATAEATGGKVRVEPGASNPLLWFFADASDKLTLNVGTGGCGLLLWDGTPITVNGTSRNIKISNPGSVSVVVKIVILVAK